LTLNFIFLVQTAKGGFKESKCGDTHEGVKLASKIPDECVSAVLSGMQRGKVAMAIANDGLAHDLVRMLMSKVSNSVHHINYVRGRMRNLANVLLELWKNVPELKTACIRYILSPVQFTAIVSANKTISDLNIDAYVPSIGVNIGHDLSFLADMVKTVAHMDGDLDSARTAESFETVLKSRW
jgi:hypothetical protein